MRSQDPSARIPDNLLNPEQKSNLSWLNNRASRQPAPKKSRMMPVNGTYRRSILFFFCSCACAPHHVAMDACAWARQPVSRVLCPAACAAGDGHSSRTSVAGRLARPTRTTGPETGLPAAAGASSLLGLAPGGVYRAVPVAGDAVRPYRTLSPSPAGCALRRGPGGQTALCGTFPGVAPAGHYPAPCFRGARTFLPRVAPGAAIRPPDPL